MAQRPQPQLNVILNLNFSLNFNLSFNCILSVFCRNDYRHARPEPQCLVVILLSEKVMNEFVVAFYL